MASVTGRERAGARSLDRAECAAARHRWSLLVTRKRIRPYRDQHCNAVDAD
jgi:hypothetical protein